MHSWVTRLVFGLLALLPAPVAAAPWSLVHPNADRSIAVREVLRIARTSGLIASAVSTLAEHTAAISWAALISRCDQS